MTLMTLYIFSWEHGKGWNSWPSLVLRVLPPTCRKGDRFVVGDLNWKNGEETQLDGKHDGLRWKSFHCQTCECLTYLDISKSIKHKHLRMNIYRSKSLNPRFGVDAGIARRLESRGDCDGRLSAREGRKLVLA